MKTILKLECPYCNAPLEYESGREQMFCQYCGKKILLVDENSYNLHQTIQHVDDAELKRIEAEKTIQLKRLELAEKKRQVKEKTKVTKIVFSVILGLLGMAMLCFGYLAGSASDDPDSGYYFISMIGIFPIFGIMHMWMSNSNENDDDEYGTIRIPQSIIDFDKKNYTVIESELVSAGFVNVKTVPLKDLAFGVFTKPGTVESITINGIPVSSFKKRYQPDSSVIITYHSK